MSFLASRDGHCIECRQPVTAMETWLSWCEQWDQAIHQDCERAHHGMPPAGRPLSRGATSEETRVQ